MKPVKILWSLNCRDCFNCKRKTFRDFDNFKKWLDDQYIEMRVNWERNFIKDGIITMYWCEKETPRKPKMLPPGQGRARKSDFCEHMDN